jgi:hypothetical protein
MAQGIRVLQKLFYSPHYAHNPHLILRQIWLSWMKTYYLQVLLSAMETLEGSYGLIHKTQWDQNIM